MKYPEYNSNCERVFAVEEEMSKNLRSDHRKIGSTNMFLLMSNEELLQGLQSLEVAKKRSTVYRIKDDHQSAEYNVNFNQKEK